MLKHEPPLYRLLAGCIIITALTALASGGSIGNTLAGFLRIQRHSARLISDFTLVGGTGSALLNAAIMGTLALGLIRGTRVALSGPTVAAVFTVMGFSLFGKTPVNTVPIVAGVWIASRLARKPLSHYLLMALFGTALGPLVSFFAAESGHGVLVSALLGAGAGLLVGTLLPGLSMAMLRMHEGFNLYNIGLACGFFGLFLASFLAAGGHDMTPGMIWNTNPSPAPAMLCVVICGFFLAQARIMEGPRLKEQLRKMSGLTGRLPSDFMTLTSCGAALANARRLGLAAMLYLVLIRAPINGPVLGGLFTVIGFATFGKHPRNCWPVALGVLLATLAFGKNPAAPGPVLALLFGTTLAPLAGEFGWRIGIAAGFVHLVVVESSAAWHGGLDLYNNGFAGGLTATLFVAIIQWLRATRPVNMPPREPARRRDGDAHEK